VDDGRSIKAEVRDAPPHDHAVHIYADDRAISQELVRFVEDGLVLGESVVVVANSLNRAAIAAWRADHPPVGDSDFLLVADASETLETFMVAGKPDPALFEATVGSIVEWAARSGRTLRVFGEMVAVLWAAGNVTGALALEGMWNDMASNRQFFLLCAYPEVLLAEAPLADVNAMCDRHSDLSSLGQLPQFAAATTATALSAQRLLIPAPDAVSVACQFAKRTLVDWELPHLIENCDIVTSELAANALLHAESSFRLMVYRDSEKLRIAVEDAVPRLTVANSGSGSAHGGLATVAATASDWGCDVTPDGKTVWAELEL
jgi:hypothetical protein